MSDTPWGHDKGFGTNPLDKVVNFIGAVTDGKNKVKHKAAAPKRAVQNVKNKARAAVGADKCKHKGVKRGQVCGCGTKLL